MDPKQFTIKITQMTVNLKKAIDDDLPKILGNKAASMFRQNFQDEGFFGTKWKEVKRRQPMTVTVTLKSGKKKKKQLPCAKGADGKRKILTGRTGNLGRSIQYKVSKAQVTIYSDTKYGKAHNIGDMTGRGHKVKMPKRQFIGDHPKLHAELEKLTTQYINKIIGK